MRGSRKWESAREEYIKAGWSGRVDGKTHRGVEGSAIPPGEGRRWRSPLLHAQVVGAVVVVNTRGLGAAAVHAHGRAVTEGPL